MNGYFEPFPRSLGYSTGRVTVESRYGNIPGGDFGMDDVQCQVRPISFLKIHKSGKVCLTLKLDQIELERSAT